MKNQNRLAFWAILAVSVLAFNQATLAAPTGNPPGNNLPDAQFNTVSIQYPSGMGLSVAGNAFVSGKSTFMKDMSVNKDLKMNGGDIIGESGSSMYLFSGGNIYAAGTIDAGGSVTGNSIGSFTRAVRTDVLSPWQTLTVGENCGSVYYQEISGGFYLTNSSVKVEGSYPASNDFDSWYVKYVNNSGSNQTVKTYAVCWSPNGL